jgi:hypothetical protein
MTKFTSPAIAAFNLIAYLPTSGYKNNAEIVKPTHEVNRPFELLQTPCCCIQQAGAVEQGS